MIIKWATVTPDKSSGLNSTIKGIYDTKALWHLAAAVGRVVFD